MHPALNMDESVLAAFCARHNIRRLSLFGSTLTGADRQGSDIDLLVEFERGKVPGLLALAGMEAELSELLGGRPVDLRTPQDLSRYFREDVLRSAEVQYAR
ncbi:MAG: nucleotidyltransferase family protein [Proteobacteria bacterium]|nr:nucleotidyltransferase family protein [Pseudomonadota bacterium]